MGMKDVESRRRSGDGGGGAVEVGADFAAQGGAVTSGNTGFVVDDERAALLLSGQKRYTAYRAEKDPARGMLTRFYGSEWTESYIHGVLFDLEEATATSLSPQGS